jgi:mono/diheme cytochrome c family protein
MAVRHLVAWLAVLASAVGVSRAAAQEPPAGLTPQQRGYWFLVNRAYVAPADFDQETFDAVWTVWPEPLRSQAEKAVPDERRKMAYSRYGLTPRPDDPTRPLQYVVDERGVWTMNCFACHGGKVAGQVWPGLPNSLYALQTLSEETSAVAVAKGKPLGRMVLGSALVPLGSTNGTTNAVNFGVFLMAYRDADLNVHASRLPPKMIHHDMDAPPWWHFAKKKMIYIDGFAAKGHRGLMQFMMVPKNGPLKFRQWEEEFRDVFAYLSSLQPPKYPYPIDHGLAERGRIAFEMHCAECHGTYGPGGEYPERLVPIDVVRTDRVRLDALSPAHRDAYGQSWFNHFGKAKYLREPCGYVAPPLDGIWASGPYFHNGSVPTLWHVLHPSERPTVWKRSEEGYDREKVGLEAEVFGDLPADAKEGWQRRQFFDTRAFGKSAAGHNFPDVLSEEEKRAVLEYLKTL